VQPELAVKFFERANNMAPEDTNIMDALADVHLQLDNQEEALALLLGLFYFICVYIDMIPNYIYADIYTDICADICADNNVLSKNISTDLEVLAKLEKQLGNYNITRPDIKRIYRYLDKNVKEDALIVDEETYDDE
jgi:hypothetical protein